MKSIGRLSIVVVTLLVVFSISMMAYAVSSGKTNNDVMAADSRFENDVTNLVSDMSMTKVAAKQKITKTYLRNEMCFLGVDDTGELRVLSSAPRSLYSVNENYPIECLKSINENLVYAVYKVKDSEDGVPYHMYLFFEKLEQSETNAVSNESETWWLTGRVFFAIKPLSFMDFKDVKVGTAIGEVIEIDPITSKFIPANSEPYTREYYNFETDKYESEIITPDPVLSFKTYHYLSDGILCISYTRSNENEEFTVDNVGLNESFQLARSIYRGTVEARIDPIDLSV